jgi:hypothetical protein
MRKRKSVGKPKQKFIAYAKVYKLVDGKYVPEHDSDTLLRQTYHSEGIGLNEFKSSCKGINLASAMEKLVLKKRNLRMLKKMDKGDNLIKISSSHWSIDMSYLSDAEKKEHYDNIKLEITRTSDTIINGLDAIAHKVSFNDKGEQILTVYNVKQMENKVMKTNYIRSNSLLAKRIHKRFEKYSSNLNCKMPRYYINRRDMVEKFGSSMMEETSDCTCIGKCWSGGWNLIWIDVNYHDKRWGDDKKEFWKHLDNTIAHEMVHLKFSRKSHPLHVDHEGSKRSRAFERRIRQVKRGHKYV